MRKTFLSVILAFLASQAFSQIFLYKTQTDWENKTGEEYTEYYAPAFGGNEDIYMFLKKGEEKVKLEKRKYWAIEVPAEGKFYRMYKHPKQEKLAWKALLVYQGNFCVYILGTAQKNERTGKTEFSYSEICCSNGINGKLVTVASFDKEYPQFKDDLKKCGALNLECVLNAAGPPAEQE